MFYAEKILKLLIQLPVILSIIGIAGILLYNTRRRKTGKYLLVSTAVLIWFFSTQLGAKLLVCPLTKNLEPISAAQLPTKANILVLGGGCRITGYASAAEQLSVPSLRRVMEGIRIKKLMPDSKLILSGTDWRHGCDIAATGHRLISEWNPDIKSIEELNPARNTREEAALYKLRYGTRDTLILITSAIHMKRAERNFRKAGIRLIPAPTDYRFYNKGFSTDYIFPDPDNLSQSTAAWSEWIALLANR